MLTLTQLTVDTLWADLALFFPELLLCTGIVVLLLLRLLSSFDGVHLGWFALGVASFAFGVSFAQWTGAGIAGRGSGSGCFSGLLVYDSLTIFSRLLLLGFAALAILLTMLTKIPDADDSGDFYVLFLGGILGMLIMASANHLLMGYIAVEMASLPSYALAGFVKGQRRASEAALKYVVYGGGAAGVMLYGISLVAGKFGTGYLPDIALGIADALNTSGVDVPLAMGLIFILVGLAFKLSAVPFHFWCPDVFEGASAEIGAYLSVASKAAAMALTGRIVLTLAGVNGATAFAPTLALFAAITATFGNLAAYSQTNIKRLLAYSTIAHAGIMIMGLAIVNRDGLSSVLFYLTTYLFTNLGAFAVVAFLRNRTGSEELSAYRGLIQREPWLVVSFGVFLLSLLGLPPLAGFAAKFVVFARLYDAANLASQPWLGQLYWSLLVIGGLNTAVSAFYYVRVLKIMVIESPSDESATAPPVPLGASAYCGVLAAVVLALGIGFNFLAKASDKGVAAFPVAVRGEARP